MRNLIRVLKATLKGPQRGSQHPTRSRPHTGQGATTSAGNQPDFQPRTGRPPGRSETRSLMRVGVRMVGGGAGMAKSAQDRRVYTPSTSGAVRDRRPGHSSYRTVCGVDRPDHPGTTGRAARWARSTPRRHRRRADLPGRGPSPAGLQRRAPLAAAAPSRVGHLFPRRLSQPAYNRRLRASAELMEAALRWLAGHPPATSELLRLLDGTPVVCGRSPTTATRSGLAGWAGDGHDTSHRCFYWAAGCCWSPPPTGP